MNALAARSPAALTRPLPLDRNPAAVYLAGLGPGSRRTMRQALDAIAALLQPGTDTDALTLPWWELRAQHTAAIRSQLAAHHAPATANKALAALRGVLRAAWRLELMAAEEYQRAADIPSVRGSTLPAGRGLGAGEIAALLDVCATDPTARGYRDGALLAVLIAGGLRRAELVALDLADFDPATGALRVRGKGGRERLVYLVNGAAAALADWLNVRGPDAGPLFWPVEKGGRMARRRMSTQAVYLVLRRRAAEARIPDTTPHDLRRTFVGALLDAGADLALVQRLAGHASPTTTARYDRRPEDAKRRAVELVRVPYRRG